MPTSPPQSALPRVRPDRGADGLIHNIRRIFAAAPRRRRMQGIAVLVLMLAGAVAELATLGAVVPLLTLLANPTAIARLPLAGRMLAAVGLAAEDALVGVVALFCLFAVVAAAVRITLAWASQKFVFRLGHDLGCALYERVLYQPYAFHLERDSSQIVAAVTKVQQVLNQAMLPVLQGLSAAIIALFILGGLLAINAPVALGAGMGFGLIYMAVSWMTRVRLRRNSRVIATSGTQRIKTVQEGLGGIRDVLIDQSQPVYLNTFRRIDDRLREAQAANAMIAAAPRFVIEAVGMMTIACIALLMSRQPGGLIAALPVLGALALGAQRLLPLLQLIYNGWTSIVGGRASLLDVLGFVEQPLPDDLAQRRALTPLPFQQALELRAVDFRYGPDRPRVVRDLTLRIERGMRIGLVGRSGSGKSTIIDLITGLLSPTAGTIAIDGQPLAPADVPRWQLQVAHVPQHIFLADATILENIAFGIPRSTIDEARVIDAARRAELDEFVAAQPDGYASVVGERGVRLSGGQRQRIGIARALYKRSAVLILDEATSALDDATEESVMRSIERLRGDVTVLIVAHRTSTLRQCDLVCRIEHGVVVAKGGYDEVVGRPLLTAVDAERAARAG